MSLTTAEPPFPNTICVVDDDPRILRLIGLLLVPDGFTVLRFCKGEDFIAYVGSHEVPLVVLDLWMKEMSGLEVLARLCALSPQTQVIVITGSKDSAARTTALQIGPVAFLSKPFDNRDFLALIHRTLGHPESAA